MSTARPRLVPRLVTLLTLLALAAGAGSGPGRCRADESLAPIRSACVTTALRTLAGCPRKHLILEEADYRRVVQDLEGAPAPPRFPDEVVALIVTDRRHGGHSRITGLSREGEDLKVLLEREEPSELAEEMGEGDPALDCFFLVVPRVSGGIHLEQRTLLGPGGASGFVQRPSRASPADRDPSRLPLLGPDLLLEVTPPPGGALPAPLLLRTESSFPGRKDLPSRSTTVELGPEGRLALRYPLLTAQARYVLAAHAEGLRSENALVLEGELPLDASGSPRRTRHSFRLEPIPGGQR